MTTPTSNAPARTIQERLREMASTEWLNEDDAHDLTAAADYIDAIEAEALRTSPARVFEELANRWDSIAGDATPRGDYDLPAEVAAQSCGYAVGIRAAAMELRALTRTLSEGGDELCTSTARVFDEMSIALEQSP